MRVLLTGSAGFVGRHLHAALGQRGDDVRTVDLIYGLDCLEFFRVDRTRYDLAIHCAAIVGGRAAIDGSPLAVATNLALDSWYFRWLVQSGTPRAVYFSSSAVYPTALQSHDAGHRQLRETDVDLSHPSLPDVTYGLAKLTGEQLAAYARGEGVSVAIARPFSGYGEDQDLDYPFPSFAARARQRADPFEIWGSGQQVRDWIHIDDVVAGILAVVDADVVEPVNLCTGRATSFDELARAFMSAAGYDGALKELGDRPQGVAYRVGDPTRMLSIYEPKVSLEEGIRRALAVQ